MLEIAHRTKKLLRSWKDLLNTTSINLDRKPRLILKVKLNSSLTKRKRTSTSRKIRLKSSTVSAIFPEQISTEPVQCDLSTICAAFQTVADLVEDHRRRIFIEHESSEIEARPDLLLAPLDQLAYVYEREKLRQIRPSTSSTPSSSMTSVEKLTSPSNFLALPFIDCPMEFPFILDELVLVEQSPIEI